MKYIQGTIGLSLVISIYKFGNIQCYIDSSYVVHKYMRSQTDILVTV